MALINQDIRYADFGDPVDNPLALYEFVKPSRVVFMDRPPTDANDGENEWSWIDTTSGVWYVKKNGVWVDEYVIGGGGPPSGINGATNLGTGAGIFDDVVGTDLTFRSLRSTDASVSIEVLPGGQEIDIRSSSGTVKGGDNLGAGIPLFAGEIDQRLKFRTLTSTSGRVFITAGPDTINLDINPAEEAVQGAVNEGGGAPLFIDRVADNLRFRTLTSSTGKVTLAPGPLEVNFGVNLVRDDVGLKWVQNLANGWGVPFPPPASADSTNGFQQGSIWTQIGGTPPAAEIRLWSCADASPGAAVWILLVDSAAPITNHLKMAVAVGAPTSIPVSFSSTGPAVFPNGAGWLTHATQGSWSVNVNTGLGPVVIRRNFSTDGAVDNLYRCAVSLNLDTTAALADRSRSLVAAVYIGSLSGSAIPGSAGPLSIAPATPGVAVTASFDNTFLYRATTAGPVDFILGWRYPDVIGDGAFTGFISHLEFVVTQV